MTFTPPLPTQSPRATPLLLAGLLRLIAPLTAISVVGFPQEAEALDRFIRLLATMISWEILRLYLAWVAHRKGIFAIGLLAIGLIAIGMLQVVRVAFPTELFTMLLFALGCAGIAGWLLRKEDLLAAWAVDTLGVVSFAIISFLIFDPAWDLTVILLGAGFGCSLAAPLLILLYSGGSLQNSHRRFYLGASIAGPLSVSVATIQHSLPYRYGTVIFLLVLLRPIHRRIYSAPHWDSTTQRWALLVALLLPLTTAILTFW